MAVIGFINLIFDIREINFTSWKAKWKQIQTYRDGETFEYVSDRNQKKYYVYREFKGHNFM